ncbi:MAG: hypothetical protein ACLTUB_01965 [Bifidobacterium longum]
MAVQDDATVAAKRAAVIKAREVALQAKADAVSEIPREGRGDPT